MIVDRNKKCDHKSHLMLGLGCDLIINMNLSMSGECQNLPAWLEGFDAIATWKDLTQCADFTRFLNLKIPGFKCPW